MKNVAGTFQELDWRGQLEFAIAYRIVESNNVTPDVARAMVRDFMRKGAQSEAPKMVQDAIISMFGPVLQSLIPLIPQFTSALMQIVQRQNERGLLAESHIEEPV